MARSLLQNFSVNTVLFTIVQMGVLQLFFVFMAIAERCTRAVPRVQTYPAKKVHVLRRIPASCSNWDKAWAWLTKVDCGTKYRLDYVTVPPREVKQYKLQYVCCDGDTDCKEAENIHASGFDSTDEKFLAIVLGSTAACVVIIIIIFAITFYTKKTRCLPICDGGSHVYASAEADDSHDGNRDEKCYPEDIESETDQKGCEAEYAEIGDARLPRYTDIFKDTIEDKGDPFNKASAPPMYSEVPPRTYLNTEQCRAPPSLHSSAANDEIQVIQASSPTLSDGADEVFEGGRHQHHGMAAGNAGEAKYYNVREKKKKKKRSSGSSQSGSTTSSSNRGERRSESSSRRSKSSLSTNVEMMTKSSSASETIGKTSETSLTKQKRRSAPPDSVDVPIGVIHNHPPSTYSPPPASVSRSFSQNTCSVIHEAPASHRNSDTRHKTRVSKDNLQQKPVRKTSRGNDYEYTSDSSPTKVHGRGVPNSYSNTDFADVNTTSGSISPSNGAVLTCCDSPSKALPSIESESPSEKDSLLRTPSCHSGCGSDRNYEDCEHCSKYDRLHYPSDNDAASLHVYQCLEEVRREVQELRAKSPSALSSRSATSPTKSDIHVNGSIVREDGSVDNVPKDKKHHKELAHC